ncbi:uncharacterized protein LOC116321963 [Oreochromis aureus]|uniref:uncharacterized protein LOC116321963 n=1 Tax=Oreochromis aureus TaxID=47969 RepID=UPI001952DC74|nr:uncharacterized protein LOC116321963 [Oreochromis aureus]
MKILYLVLLFQASLQLECDKREITAHVGGEFILKCKYGINNFLYSKKYWCRGPSRSNCEIVADSENSRNTHRSQVIDLNRRGLFVKVTNLRFDDAGAYWVGIDKIYADIMTQVKVIITEVPVSKPRLWPLSSLVDRPTCWGKSVTLRCDCAKGTGVRYAWYQHIDSKDFLLHKASDLYLHCGTVQKDCSYFCIGSNDISSEKSELISVQVLMPANSSCIYVVNIQGQPIYDCADRMSTTTVTTPTLTSCLVIMNNSDNTGNQSLQLNETTQGFFFIRSLAGLPLWCTLLRWSSFLALLIIICTTVKCTRRRYKKYANQKTNIHCRRIYHACQ